MLPYNWEIQRLHMGDGAKVVSGVYSYDACIVPVNEAVCSAHGSIAALLNTITRRTLQSRVA
jgi:hypothetical protein